MSYFNEQAFDAPVTNGFYGSQPIDQAKTFQTGGIGSGFYNSPDNYGAGWNQFAGAFGGGSESHFANWLRQRASRSIQDYTSANAANPDLNFTDYVTSKQGNYQNEFAGMNPTDRGGQTGQRGLRWL